MPINTTEDKVCNTPPSSSAISTATKPLDDPLLAATLGIALFGAGFGMFLFLALDDQSLWIAIAGLAYFFLLGVGWIALTDFLRF